MKTFVKSISFSFTLTLVLLLSTTAQAQLHVDAAGEVGIGTANSTAKLHVYNTTTDKIMYLWHSYAGPNHKYGLYNNVSSAGTGSHFGIYNTVTSNPASPAHMGIYNYNVINSTGSGTGFGQFNVTSCSGGTGYRYGIYNYLSCGSGCNGTIKNAFYSGVSSACGGYAGYFSGDVYVSGTVTQTSDASKKTNIVSMNGALSLLSQLKPKTYDYINDDNLALPRERQFGFLAQDLEEVLPELVKDVDVVTSPEPGVEGEEVDLKSAGTIKTVNYTGLIPVLVQGIQEQQATIEEQSKMILEQQKRIEALEVKVNQ